ILPPQPMKLSCSFEQLSFFLFGQVYACDFSFMHPRLITRRGLVAGGDRPAPTEPAGENVGDYSEICLTASELFAP
ncbi:hypothetical protein, partial [Hominenteromicrobium sp.]|uniref:hypothetical protein n=1 Tax=Hominenteromicrobium sp. TaxID=3073581 RepID=UPI003A922310